MCAVLLHSVSAAAADLVYLNTPAGEQRLVGATQKHQFFAVEPYLETQQNLAFCGPASMVAVLNSLDVARPVADVLYPYPFFTQSNIFNADTRPVKSYAQVATRGMTLDEVGRFLVALGVKVSTRHAEGMTLEELRALVATTLADPDKRLIVNFNRKVLGEIGGGHLSPLGAFDQASDSVLLLDVARFKYPPTWVPLADLLPAMQSPDPDSGQSRGLIVVEKQR